MGGKNGVAILVSSAILAGVAVALTAAQGPAQGPDRLPLGTGSLQSRIECRGRPITVSGPQLASQIRDLEESIKRSTAQVRNLGDRFRASSEELERVGNQLCNERAAYAQRALADAFGNVFDIPGARGMRPQIPINSANRPLILHVLQQRVAVGGDFERQAARQMIREINAGAAAIRTADALKEFSILWSQAAAATPTMFTCGPTDDTPQMDTSLAVLVNSFREILKEIHPWFRYINPLIDQENWVAWYTLYRSGPRAIQQFSDLTTTQMIEWETTTCILNRDIETLKNARQMLATEAEVARLAQPQKGGGGMSAGAIAGYWGAAGAGIYGLKLWQEHEKKKADSKSCGTQPSLVFSGGRPTDTSLNRLREWCSCRGLGLGQGDRGFGCL